MTSKETCTANCVTGNNSYACLSGEELTGNQDCFVTGKKDNVRTLTVNSCFVVNHAHSATGLPQKAQFPIIVICVFIVYREDRPGGSPSHETLSVASQGALEYPQLLDILLPWSETISVHLEWWQNTVNMMKGSNLHPKDHSIQIFTDASNIGWGTHLEQDLVKGLWSDSEKKTTHNWGVPLELNCS